MLSTRLGNMITSALHAFARRRWVASLLTLALSLGAGSLASGQAPEKEPGPRATGKVYTWTASNGLAYEFYVPKSYDPDAGASLTMILHGSNLDRRWGFANHRAGEFRADDIVVSPDGTTSNGKGGFNSLQKSGDLVRLHELHQELRQVFRINATYLYGHSQGSFFAFYYAGAYPDEVQGVVGHASGVWIGTKGGKSHHHQAIVLMHGSKDPVVSYGQSVASLSAHYRKLKYPMARLRTLDGWNHWPSQKHAAQQLAWCEGMTTDDPVRIAASIETLDKVKEGSDPVAAHQVAARALTLDGLDGKTKKAAEKALASVEKAANAHVAAINKSVGKNRKLELDDKPWVGHARIFLRHFEGTPQCDELREEWSRTLERHGKDGKKLAKGYWDSVKSDPSAAFSAGVALVSEAFLRRQTADDKILDQLEAWAEDAKALKLKKSQKKAFATSVPVFRSALEKGEKAYAKVSKRYR